MNKTIDDLLIRLDLDKCEFDHCVCFMRKFDLGVGGNLSFIVLCVDELIISWKSAVLLLTIKSALYDHLKMSNLAKINLFLGMEIDRDPDSGTLYVRQSKFLQSILAKCGEEQKKYDGKCGSC